MFKIPLCLEVIAGDELTSKLEDMGIEMNGDIWNDPTFTVCFYKIDAIMPDERSTRQKPITCVVCGDLAYLCKYDMATIVDMIAAVS